MDVYLEEVDLAKLVDEVRMMVEPLIEKNGNRLVIDCPADIGSMRADLTKLKQSLINLLSNAAKFTKGGTVRLTMSRDDRPATAVARQLRGDGHRHRHDRGADRPAVPGVHPGRRLDHPQFRRHRPRPDHHQAFLPPCWAAHRRAPASRAKGSTFTLDLPDQPVGGAGRRAGTVADELRRGDPPALTVLVVDDDPAVHDVLRRRWRKEGYRLLHAHDGARGARDRCARRRPTSSRSTS